MQRYIFPILLAFGLLSCSGPKESNQSKSPSPASSATEDAHPKVRLKTSMGTIVLELNREKAPITVENFIQYVKSGHYNGTAFHRVIQNFMIQGGGFELADGKLIEKTTKPGIKNESTNGLRNQRGSIAMARTADPDSASAQFFINVVDNSMLDYPNNGGYAVFGKVIEGMDVVDQIKAVGTGTSTLSMLHPMTGQRIEAPASDVPRTAVIILEASVD